MNEPITQSDLWKKLQDDLHEESFFCDEKSYKYLAILKSTPAGNYLYLPYGPVAKDHKSFDEALKSLKTLAKEQNAIFIRIEPQDTDISLPKNAKKSKDLNPKETWVLDIKGDNYRDKMPSRLLRYHRNAEKNGIKIETSHNPDDIKHLLKLQKSLAKEKGISTFSEDYLKTELKQPFATLYLVKYDPSIHEELTSSDGTPRESQAGEETTAGPAEQIIAAGLVFDYKDVRYNLQGAQSEQGRKLHATGILTIQLIEDAKEKGMKVFDFWGIAPENAPKDHPWAGFTNFKKTFAGEERDYLGTYDIVENPMKYRLYKNFRSVNRMMRRARGIIKS